IFRSGFQHKPKWRKAAKPVTHGRLAPRDPDRIGYDDRVCMQVAQVGLDKMFEVRTADFLFKFPDETDIERHFLRKRHARPEESSECRPLIVGGPTAKVAS